VESGKIVAAICHAPWLLVETGTVNGRDVTSYAAIRTDVINAGGRWIDQQVVADNGIITSRHPGRHRRFRGQDHRGGRARDAPPRRLMAATL
jgi:putative intracellular protease/amidase